VASPQDPQRTRGRPFGVRSRLVVGVLNFESAYRRFPRNGKEEALRPAWTYSSNGSTGYDGAARDISYMFAILPFVEEQALYDRALKNALTNASTGGKGAGDSSSGAATIVSVFRCPSDDASTVMRLRTSKGAPFNYCCNAGDVFYDKWGVSTRAPFGWYGGSGTGTDRRIKDVLDGTANTIMLAEICSARSSPNNSVTDGVTSVSTIKGTVRTNVTSWASGKTPADCLQYADLSISGIWCNSDTGPGANWLQREYVYLFTVMPPNSPTCTSTTGANVRNCGGGGYATASSFHDGGTMFAMCDAAVRFIGDSIDAGLPSATIQSNTYAGQSVHGVYGMLGSMKGGESIGNSVD